MTSTDKVKYCCYSNLPVPINGYKTDSSWGCTLRNFQSLVLSFVAEQNKAQRSENLLKNLYENELSVPNIVRKGGFQAGKWTGPIKVAQTLSKILSYVEMYKNPQTPRGQDVLVLVPMRLGMESIDPIYIQTLYDLIKHPLFMGMVCGKGGSSLLIMGMENQNTRPQSNSLHYLDPHYYRSSNSANHFQVPYGQWKGGLVLDELEPTMVLAFKGNNSSLQLLIEKLPIYIEQHGNDNDKKVNMLENEEDDFVVLD